MAWLGNPRKYAIYLLALIIALVVLTVSIYFTDPSINYDNVNNSTTIFVVVRNYHAY